MPSTAGTRAMVFSGTAVPKVWNATVHRSLFGDAGLLVFLLAQCLDGVFTEHPDGRFSVGPLGAFLREDAPDSQRGPVLVRGGLYYPAAQGLLDMATGTDRTPAFERHYGQPFFAHLDQTPDHAALFQTSMAGRAAHEAAAIVKHYDLTGLGHLVDVGAGPGVLAQAALQASDDLTVTLLDRPAMIERASRGLAAALPSK